MTGVQTCALPICLPEELEKLFSSGDRMLTDRFEDPDEFFRSPSSRRSNLQAWVTVVRGCNNFCSYCVVPYARGREISRPPAAIVEEVRTLGEGGCKDVTLLGQNVNSYHGVDISGEAIDFAALLRRINLIEGIERIRFLTSHPKDISPALIVAVAELEKVCEFLHFPAQSGSDHILKKMRRGYTSAEYLEKVRMLKAAIPNVSLASDFIVGFPGETDDDFSRTRDLLRKVRFDRIFAFTYSPRPKTEAALWPDDIPPAVKSGRLQKLLALQRAISLENNRNLLGQVVEVLVEGRNRKFPERGEGRTRSGQAVFFPWKEGMEGRLVSVRIERVTDLSLFGMIISGSK